MSRALFVCVLFLAACMAVAATSASTPPYALPPRFAAHVSIQSKGVQLLGNMFADWASVQQQKHILEFAIINGTQVELAHTTLWSNTTSGCRWDRDLYDLLCVGAFICTCGPVANYPSVCRASPLVVVPSRTHATHATLLAASAPSSCCCCCCLPSDSFAPRCSSQVPQYPVGLNPTNGGYVNYNGQRCLLYLNSSTSIAYLVNAVNGGPVAVVAGWNTNDQTVYTFLRWGDTFSDASLHHRCINVDVRHGENAITDATTLEAVPVHEPIVPEAGAQFAEDAFLEAFKRFNW